MQALLLKRGKSSFECGRFECKTAQYNSSFCNETSIHYNLRRLSKKDNRLPMSLSEQVALHCFHFHILSTSSVSEIDDYCYKVAELLATVLRYTLTARQQYKQNDEWEDLGALPKWTCSQRSMSPIYPPYSFRSRMLNRQRRLPFQVGP